MTRCPSNINLLVRIPPLFSHPIDTSISTNPSGSSNVARTNRWTLTSNDPLYPVTSNDQMPQQHQPPRQNTPLFSHPIDTSISTNPSGSSNVAKIIDGP